MVGLTVQHVMRDIISDDNVDEILKGSNMEQLIELKKKSITRYGIDHSNKKALDKIMNYTFNDKN